ncbi:sensor histidine kinase [Granulicella cerasi]|uniref:histidine kinase n=1 Tax=Granulicella cerasi TaxID=741063 RepID=A0ABW1ZC62_9BACT|nr:ATP-binding protein [Granulicella cerasi]
MRIFRSLYVKIFGWFWLTFAASAVLVVAVTLLTGSRPIGTRWTRMTQDLYAHTAIDFYTSGGEASLDRYLDIIDKSSTMNAALLDAQGRSVSSRPVPPNIGVVLEASRRTGESRQRLGRVWVTSTPLISNGQRYYFVIEIHPKLGGFLDGTFARPIGVRLLLAALIAALLCVLLTRHIVAPMRALQAGALRLASGDLSTRVLPAVSPREDEIADTAKAFDQMAERMQVLIERRQEMLADISHELRSPLTRISVSLELMRRGEMDVLDRMETDVERMNAMIGQILLLTRLDMQPSSMARERIELRSMLESLAQDASFEAQSEDKHVRVEMSDAIVLPGDANLLRSALENVVRNAVHYTAPRTAVVVRAARRNVQGRVMCEVVVEDCGPGVPDDVLRKLFDPFFRVSEAREHDVKGSGLGLSITRRIVDLHGGMVYAEKCAGGGLCVVLQLPLE